MSDEAVASLVASLVTGLVTISTMIIGFLTLWVKLKYAGDKAEEAAKKANVVEGKIDVNARAVAGMIETNTAISTEAKNAAQKTEKQTNGALNAYDARIEANQQRIAKLETEMLELKAAMKETTKAVDSTRHEVRGHFQTLSNKLDIMALAATGVPIPNQKDFTK